MSGARSDDEHDGAGGGSHGDARDDARRALDAWRDLCRRLELMGERVLSDDFPPHERVALLEHLAGQAMCWTGWSVFHADAGRPAFQRQNDLVTPWGGPNADNVYRHARVDPGRSYRIRGRMHSCEDFLLTVRAGFMHEPRWGTIHEVSASDLGIRQGDTFELLVGGESTVGPPADGTSPPPRWVPLPDGAAMVFAIDVGHAGALAATDKDWVAPDGFVGPHGGIDAAGQELFCSDEGTRGFCVSRSLSFWHKNGSLSE